MYEILRRRFLGNRHNFLLYAVEYIFDFLGRLESVFGYLRGSFYEVAENFFLADDFRVMVEVRGGGHLICQFSEIRRASDIPQDTLFFQPVSQSQNIYRLVLIEKFYYCFINFLVGRSVKIS